MISVEYVAAAAPFQDIARPVTLDEQTRLRALMLSHPDSEFVFCQNHKVYGFIRADGSFGSVDQALVDMVWPGYTLDEGYVVTF